MLTPRATTVALALGAALLGGALLVGCTGATVGGTNDQTTRTGTLQVLLTDAASDYQSVFITIKEVRVVESGDGEEEQNQEENGAQNGNGQAGASARAIEGLPLIVDFDDEPLKVDILALSFRHQLLGAAQIPAGSYNQVRLVLAENESGEEPVNYVTYEGNPDEKVPIETPSAQKSGLKIVGQFTVEEGGLDTIVLDFDPDRAIHETGNGKLMFKPTGIRITQVDNPLDAFGALNGVVLPAEARETALVEAFGVGETEAAGAGTVDLTDGTFRIFLPPGTYTVRVSADNCETYDSAQLDPPGEYTIEAAGDEETVPDITLVTLGALTGTVSPGEARSAALVEAFAGSEVAASGPVDAEGVFRLVVPVGTYTVRVSAGGYVDFNSPELEVLFGTDTAVGDILLEARSAG